MASKDDTKTLRFPLNTPRRDTQSDLVLNEIKRHISSRIRGSGSALSTIRWVRSSTDPGWHVACEIDFEPIYSGAAQQSLMDDRTKIESLADDLAQQLVSSEKTEAGARDRIARFSEPGQIEIDGDAYQPQNLIANQAVAQPPTPPLPTDAPIDLIDLRRGRVEIGGKKWSLPDHVAEELQRITRHEPIQQPDQPRFDRYQARPVLETCLRALGAGLECLDTTSWADQPESERGITSAKSIQ